MKNKNLKLDRNHHVLYSKACEKEIKKKIASHYKKDEIENVWSKVQLQYAKFLNDFHLYLGGKKNFHNRKGGNYDCFALLTYYAVCKNVTSFREIEEMEESLILPSFRKLKFVNCNKPFWKRIMYKAFQNAKKQCDKWKDYEMDIAPYDKNKPIYYEFRSCPIAEFAKQFGLIEIMPALCNVDYKSLDYIHANLVRNKTCVDSDKCDYTICGDKDSYASNHPRYRDEKGFWRNR